MLTCKIFEYGTIPIHMTSKIEQCIPKKSLFGKDFWVASEYEKQIFRSRFLAKILRANKSAMKKFLNISRFLAKALRVFLHSMKKFLKKSGVRSRF